MFLDQRAFYESTDISQKVNDYRALTAPFAATTTQHLFIGAVLPFNNLWLEMGTVNTNAATVSIQMWYGREWIDAVDIIDESAGLTASGRLQWNTDINKAWDREQYSADVTGLPATSKIYNMFWLRLSWSANLSAGTTLAYLGQKFADDTVLYSFYPDFNNSTTLTAFASGKTTWKEQHFMAAEHIVRDLQKKGIIKARMQILDTALLVDAGCHKVAEMIYTALGDPYFEQLKLARASYKEALNINYFNSDMNADGRLDDAERMSGTSFGTR